MNKRTLIEIGIASALGAVIGLSIATKLELPLWLWIPCGLVTALCYRPWEIFVVTGKVCGEMWNTLRSAIASSRHLPHFVSTINWSEVRSVGIITFQILCCFVVAWVGLMYPSLLVYLIAPLERSDATIVYLMLIPLFSFMGSLIGAGTSVLYFAACGDNRTRWILPLSTRLSDFFPESHSSRKEEESKEPDQPCSMMTLLLLCLCILFVPLVAHLFCALTIVLFLVDLVITIILACASNERLASIEGGTLGCAAGALATVAGVGRGGELLLVGGLTGLILGPYLYTLREALGKTEAVAPSA